MSTGRDFPNSGILFANDRKDGERDRDYRGTADISCPHCEGRFQVWLSGWIKNGRKGKFLSLSFKAKEASAPQGTATDDAGF
jgi:hypothetical protein